MKTAAGLDWYNEVNAAFAGGAPADLDWASWSVVTDVNATGATGEGVQEFLVHEPTVTPEPETYLLLLASGLAVLWIYARKRREDLS